MNAQIGWWFNIIFYLCKAFLEGRKKWIRVAVDQTWFAAFLLAHYWIWSFKRVAMYKMRVYLDTLSAVAEETEVEMGKIISGCKEEEVIDARAILIRLLFDQGLYPIQISRFTGICQRSVNRFLLDFQDRIMTRRMMRLFYDNVRKKIGLS